MQQSEIKINALPKYYQLKQILINEIKNKKYPPDTKLPSEKEITQKYGVSSITVRRVRHELIDEGYIYSIQGKGCFVTEKNNNINNNVFTTFKNKRIVFIMTESVLNDFYAALVKGVLDVVQKKNYTLEINYSNWKYSNEMRFLAKCLQERVSGVIFIPSHNYFKYRHIYTLKKAGIPVVLLDRYINNCDCDYITSDNFNGAFRGVKYLIDMGHKRIAFLGSYYNAPVNERFEGYKEALKKSKIKFDERLVFALNKKFNSSYEEAYQTMKKFYSPDLKITAIFTSTDGLGMCCYSYLKKLNIKVPDDISILSYGDSLMAENFEIPLTVISQDPYKMGVVSAKRLFSILENKNLISDGEKIVVKTRIIKRKSVKKLR